MSIDICDRVYDAYSGEMGQQFMRETQRRIHWMCSLARGESILDVGCSQGLVPILLGREGKSAVGIDPNPVSIKSADDRLATEQVAVRKRVSFIEGDFVQHDFGGAKFDCILMGEVLEHLLEPERFIAKAAALLQPGGRLVITVPFGINDHLDHKHTFYLLKPLTMVSAHFHCDDVTILGKWLGVVATRREGDTASYAPSLREVEGMEAAFAEIERGLVDGILDLRAKLEQANTKYRASTEDTQRLKREATHSESERKIAERAREDQAKELNELRQRGARPHGSDSLPAELANEVKARHALEIEMARLQERAIFTDAHHKQELKGKDEHLGRLERARADLAAQVQGLKDDVAKLTESSKAQQAKATETAAALQADLKARVEQCTSLTNKLATAEKAAAAAQGELTIARERIEHQQRDLVAAYDKLPKLEAALGAQHSAHRERERLGELEREQNKQAIDRLKVQLQDAERRAQQLDSQLKISRQNERKQGLSYDRELRHRLAAEERIEATKKTLSFQLGHELIEGFKSRQSLLDLPKNLWQLQQEATRRRVVKQLRAEGELPVTRPVAALKPSAEAPPPTTAAPAASSQAPIPKADRPTHPSVESAARQTAQARKLPLPKLPSDLKQLRIACIHDEFTFASYGPECVLQQLTHGNWLQELEAFQPQLLFIESAWLGKEAQWERRVANAGKALNGIVEWCRSRGIPTAFWNKEDPVHFRTFLNTAKLFDVVFTTDVDCVQRYKQALGHERVHLLPFALQPAAQNPIEKYERKGAICFAGAYYARYPERQADLASFVDALGAKPGFEIYDRNYGKTNPDYQFPDSYKPYIVGTLTFDEIDKAYKGYRYALNLNSIKASQSMFARRVYELLGSNTITLSNFSRGVRLMFGDLVVTTDDGDRAASELARLEADDSRSRRLRLAGLRKVLAEHTYGHRLRFLVGCVWQTNVPDNLPAISVIVGVQNANELERATESFQRQAYPNKHLVVVTQGGVDASSVKSLPNVRVLEAESIGVKRLSEVLGPPSHVAALVPSDHWGRHYLLDLALTTRYSAASVIGKAARFQWSTEGAVLTGDGQQYRAAARLAARRSLVERRSIEEIGVLDWLQSVHSRQLEAEDCLAIDEFNYCEGGAAAAPQLLAGVDDLVGLDHGISMAELLQGNDTPKPLAAPRSRQIDAASLARLFQTNTSKNVTLQLRGQQLILESRLADEAHEYIYAAQACSLSELGFSKRVGNFHLDVTPGVNLQIAFVFLDANKKKLSNKVVPSGTNQTIHLPEDTHFVQLGLRVYASGRAELNGLLLDYLHEAPGRLFGRADVLLVTNHYPSYQDLYRNAFVHRRVLDYAKRGGRVDVFRMRRGETPSYHEFDGIDVTSGDRDALVSMLATNNYRAILVHFLDQQMWSALKPYLGKVPLLIWAHGAEIQAWHRRASHYASPEQLETAKKDAGTRQVFWREVFGQLPQGSKLVFVSQQFADEVMTDLGVKLPEDRYEVIHNVIDTTLFEYRVKDPARRTRILSIRPYTSRIYGNDLTVAAILELSTKSYFKDLRFHLVGDGPLFEETTAPLRDFSNVELERRFLTQQEIAALHQQYGVFLCATRGDTQGVSRDEAMASGLVPITNAAGAIPEFVDGSCGFVAPREDHIGLATGIARLYEDPELFQRLSAAAAARVRQQSGPPQTTERELRLFRRVKEGSQ